MVQRVDPFIHEGRGQQRDPDQQVPAGTETGQRIAMDVRKLVNEQQRAVERQRRYQPKRNHDQRAVDQYRASERRVADASGEQHVAPVDRRARLGDILGQIARGAQHRLVVGDGHTHALCGWCQFALIGEDGLLHGHNRSIRSGRYRIWAAQNRGTRVA